MSNEEENLQAWFDAGVSCVGMGDKFISKTIMENEYYKGLKEKVRNILDVIRRVRKWN